MKGKQNKNHQPTTRKQPGPRTAEFGSLGGGGGHERQPHALVSPLPLNASCSHRKFCISLRSHSENDRSVPFHSPQM